MFKKAALAIKDASSFIFTSGAGMGVDSGLPDFRGVEGFWRNYPPMKHLGLRFEEMSTPHWFESDPEFAWGFFGHRYQLYNGAEPHEGYSILKEFGEDIANHEYFCVTSNVDGHFEKAGFDVDRIYEIHGSLHYLQSLNPHEEQYFPASESKELQKLEVDPKTFRATSRLPRCPWNPKLLARPNVLMFSDYGYYARRSNLQSNRFQTFQQKVFDNPKEEKEKEHHHHHLVVIEIGAGLYVPSIRNFSERMISQCGKSSGMKGTLIRINPRDGDIPSHSKNNNPSEEYISLETTGLKALQQLKKEVSKLK